MVRCSAPMCFNSVYKKPPNITFHRLKKSMVALLTVIRIACALILNNLFYIHINTSNVNAEKNPVNKLKQQEDTFDFRDVVKLNAQYGPVNDLCQRRIYGGTTPTVGDVPYMVALRRMANYDKIWRVFCGGSIVTPDHIITAAHCFQDRTKYELARVRVVAGTVVSHIYLTGKTVQLRQEELQRIQKEEIWRTVSNFHTHQKYDRGQVYSNDLAILKLETPILFSKVVKPIPIIPPEITLEDNLPCLTSGFGRIERKEESSSLRTVCVPFVAYHRCRQRYHFINNSTQICAGAYQKGGCRGDSGGPLTCKGYLVGVLSFGNQCAIGPIVYTRISGFTTGDVVPFVEACCAKVDYNVIEIVAILALHFFMQF